MVQMRLIPEDEYMHSVDEETHFNESMYFNVYDPAQRVGGFVRIGNRPNEKYAERTFCWYLPDGRVAFTFGRPEISHNDAFDAGGARFEVVKPFEEMRVHFDDKVVILEDPLEMADPRKAFKSNPWVPATAELTYTGVSPMFGGQLVDDDGNPVSLGDMAGFARGHYEQHVAASGTVRVGDDEWTIDGWGLRDHSWGPRHWQAPWYYRWLTANFGPDFGFMVSVIVGRDGGRRIGGIVLIDGEHQMITDATITTEWGWRNPDDGYQKTLRVHARTGTRVWEIEGAVMSLIPLRNRRTTPEGEELTTRIAEGLTEWRCEGKVGFGLSEYLDQIVDGVPVGAAEDAR